jgi:WD40 repeat protein
VLRSVREDTPPPIRASRPDVPQWLCDAIDKLLAKKIEDRFASAREVADLLTGQLAQLQQPAVAPPPPATPAPPVEKPSPGSSRGASTRLLWLLAFTGVIAVLGALAALSASLKAWQGRGTGNQVVPDEPMAGATPHQPAGPPVSLDLRRDDIPRHLLVLAGGGDSAQAPLELAAVLGDGRFLLPRIGQTAWMDASPDGKVLAVPLDEDVILFDAKQGTQLRTLKGPGGRVFFVTFSRDSRLLAASTRYEAGGGSVRLWDLGANRVLYTVPNPGPLVSCAAAFSADGRRLFTEGNGRICVRDAGLGRSLQEEETEPRGVAAICVSPDGRRLAVAEYYANRVRIFEWADDRLTPTDARLVHPSPVTAVAYSADGKFLVSGDITAFKVWDARTLEPLRTVETPAEQLAFAPDSRTLFAASTIGPSTPTHVFTRWDLVARKELPALPVSVSAIPVHAFHCLSGDGRVLFVAPQYDATYVQAIDTTDGMQPFPHRGHEAPLHIVAVSPDGQSVASAGDDQAVKLWNLPTGQVRHSLNAHASTVCGLAFSPDGRLLASGSLDGTIAIWDVDSGAEVRALHGHSRSFSRIQFSPDGKTLAAGGEAGMVKLWEVATGKERRALAGASGAVRCVAYSPDGARLAAGGDTRTVHLHDLAGHGIRKFRVPSSVNQLAFSPDSRALAAVTDGPNAAVCLWDLETGRETTWRVPTGKIHGLAFCPSAPLLATCGEDGTVRLWDLSDGNPRGRTVGPGPFGGPVRSVAFTPDGRYLVTANSNGMVYLLRVGSA